MRIFIIFSLFFFFSPALAQESDNKSAVLDQNIREEKVEILKQRETKFLEIRARKAESIKQIQQRSENLRRAMNVRLEKSKEQRELARRELAARLKVIQDLRRRSQVIKIDDQFEVLNKEMVQKSVSILQRLEEILASINARVEKVQVDGLNADAVLVSAKEATSRIADAQKVVQEQFDKIYTIQVKDDQSLKRVVIETRQSLWKDLEATKVSVNKARESVNKAVADLVAVINK